MLSTSTVTESSAVLSVSTISLDIFKVITSIRPDWSPSNTQLIPFTGSLTNTVFGLFDLRTNDTSSGLVIKIFGNQTEILIDRQNEKEVMLALASRQLARPLLLQFENGIIYGFTPGDVCSREDIAKDEIRPLIARTLAQFHSVPLSDEQRRKGPCFISMVRKFIRLLDQHGGENEAKELTLLKADIDEIEHTILPRLQPTPDLVLCHNDLQNKNFLYDSSLKCISLIDFEYTQPNYALYDIAEHFVEYAGVHDPDYSIYPTREEQLEFLRLYFHERGLTKFDEEKTLHCVNRFTASPHLLWSLWALVQANISPLDFDYTKCAQMHLNMYHKLKPILFDV